MNSVEEQAKTIRLLERAKRGHERASRTAAEYADEVTILEKALHGSGSNPPKKA